MNKLLIARLGFIVFSLVIAALILTKVLEVPIAMGVWVVGMVLFIRLRKRNKKESDK